jgi:hypothetical protein
VHAGRAVVKDLAAIEPEVAAMRPRMLRQHRSPGDERPAIAGPPGQVRHARQLWRFDHLLCTRLTHALDAQMPTAQQECAIAPEGVE